MTLLSFGHSSLLDIERNRDRLKNAILAPRRRMKANSSSSGGPQPYRVRELRAADLGKGFLATLANLSDTGGLTLAEARGLFKAMKSSPIYHTFVAVAGDGLVIGATTLLVEQKFIHRGGLVGHIEDVVVRKGHEGKGVGGSVVRAAVEKARELGCYKVILDCEADLVDFYKKLGFSEHDVGMRIDLAPRPASVARKRT
jgi:glucosamine-phosphate N-acetyltransferase